MSFPPPMEPLLSEALHELIGFAVVDRTFHDELLRNPRKAVSYLPHLGAEDRKAASAIHGAQSLAEYAVRLEQYVAGGGHRRVAVRRAKQGQALPLAAAS